MLPEIRYFPSRFFYDGILVDDLSISNKEIFNMMWPSKPYLLFDTRETVETRGTRGSVVNLFEVCLILSLIRCFTSMNPGRAHKSIAVITPYKEQKDLIEQTLIETFGESSLVPYVSTIDGFQGKECEFVIISCVRAANNIGFLSDAQRLNVAVTRAKKRCWILGNLNSLHRDKIWRHVVEDAVSRYCIIQGRESHAILRSFSDQI
jgi:senataxin